MKLTIPFGGHTYAATIKPSTSDIRFSLRTTSYQEAVARNLEAHHYVASCLEAARSDADVVLSYKQIFALAGEFYRLSVSDLDFLKGNLISWNSERGGVPGLSAGIPDDPEIYKAETFFMEVAAATAERFSQAETSGIQCDAGLRAAARLLLAKHCVPRISPESASLLVDELKRRLPEALERTARLAAGDYSPDPKLASFPAFETAPSTRATHSLSLEGLFEEWWAHAQRLGMSMATHESYSHTIRKLKAHLKTDDALSITEGDLTGFRDACLQSVTLGTATRHIVVLKSIFGWAAEHDKMPSNPASGVVLKKPRRVKLRERDFTDEEARAILTAADRLGSLPSPKLNDLMRRWVPWLCAYTGCRVGELVQLRKEDIREAEDGEWVLTITPAAGPVKSKEAREIPLHAHLVEKGFLTFWRSKPKGPLFMEATKPEAFRAAWQGKKLALAKFARSVVTDPNVSPNHAWRHTFKSKGFEAGIQEKVLDAICGHAPATVGRAYGSVTLKTKIDAMKLFPRYGGRGKA